MWLVEKTKPRRTLDVTVTFFYQPRLKLFSLCFFTPIVVLYFRILAQASRLCFFTPIIILYFQFCCYLFFFLFYPLSLPLWQKPSAIVSLVLFYSDYYFILSILLLFVLLPILPFVVTALAASETLAPC